ncbi:MAG: DUF819 family protein [Saprospiraceae bacterium]|nr:DUF819 family protein [Saprospiraceae bacterium]
MITNTLYVLAMLCLIVVLSEWLVRKTFLKHFGTALLVILVTAVIANIGILPAGSTEERPVVAYDGIFAYLAPISIFWLLLRVNLREILKAGLPMLILFLIAALGTTFGVVLGMWLVNGAKNIGEFYPAIGGMFVGTYVGGSINFNAIALHYDIVREGILYGGSVVVDNIITTIWMVATLALPRLLAPFWKKINLTKVENSNPLTGIEDDTESLHPIDLGLTLALGIGSLFISNSLAHWSAAQGYPIPSILIITMIALVIAQLPIVKYLRGAQVLGIFSVYLFLAVIGAFCDVQALQNLGTLGFVLLGMAMFAVAFHGFITFGAARLMKLDLDIAAVVSQANVGGGTSALALARSLGRQDLVLPAVLLGSFGNAIGTFLGFWVSTQLLPGLG